MVLTGAPTAPGPTRGALTRGAATRGARRRLVAPALVGLGAVAGLALVAAVDPNESGHYPTCPFLALTGLTCPGCGTLRALHALTRGDVATGFARNPATMLTLPLLAWVWVAWVSREARGSSRTRMAPAWCLYALAAAELVFWVVRNLPGQQWLAP